MSNNSITNEDWIEFLYDNKIVENEAEKQKREQVLALLNTAQTSFIRDVMKENSYKKSELLCQLFPFGSYGLGGYTRNADMDLVLICPWFIKRHDFYRFFPPILKRIATCRDVDTIRRATVPIIKCTIDSISIDISFVRLKETNIPSDINLLDDSLLDDIDSSCVASMDGPRVNQFIKSQIRREHIVIFQRCLQIIKHWAAQREIYSKPFGYINGSSWTLLLVKTYLQEKANVHLDISTLLKRFFSMWRDWPWPTPVMLTETIPGKNGKSQSYQSLTEFENAVMPIVSPCHPVCSAAPYVNKSTLKIITRELERATVILEYTIPPKALLTKLFRPVNYFKRYDHFITVLTTTTTYNSYDIWTRKISYNIPELTVLLEKCSELELIQPFIKSHTVQKNYHSLQEKRALQLGYSDEEARVLERTGQLNPGMMYLVYCFIGIKTKKSVNFVDISSQVDQFMKLLESKRNKNDDDVEWSVNVLSKKQVAGFLFSM